MWNVFNVTTDQYDTYSLRHWDLVQLHGFLGFKPLESQTATEVALVWAPADVEDGASGEKEIFIKSPGFCCWNWLPVLLLLATEDGIEFDRTVDVLVAIDELDTLAEETDVVDEVACARKIIVSSPWIKKGDSFLLALVFYLRNILCWNNNQICS